jgi:hypothetical protein
MGVRFECPAGHKLHVKAELAGKRGICPECGAKFIVQSFSGERVAEDNGAATNSTVVVNPPPSKGGARGGIPDATTSQQVVNSTTTTSVVASPPLLTQAPATPPPTPPEPTAWYIRPASGGQFGPASDEVFAQWIAEGRVSADSWVWRNGWTDWKAGGEALREYGARVPAGPALAMAAAAAPQVNVVEAGPTVVVAAANATTAAAAQVDATTAELRRAEIKRRKQKVRNLSILLAVVALAMLAALVVVLAR